MATKPKAVSPKRFSITEIKQMDVTNLPYNERDRPIEINETGSAKIHSIQRKQKKSQKIDETLTVE